MNETHFLKKIFCEPSFTKDETDRILTCFKKVEFKKNDFLLTEGTIEDRYWFVELGFIRSYVVDLNGNDISTQFYSIGDTVIDWSSFFLRTPTKETIQALTDCVCWQLDFESFQELFHSIEAFREAGRARLVKSYFELKKKSISMITEQATDRYKTLLNETPSIIQNVPLKQIATYLGVTDTSLSRIRKEISKE